MQSLLKKMFATLLNWIYEIKRIHKLEVAMVGMEPARTLLDQPFKMVNKARY